jgi:hypothetical protein
MAPKSPSWGLPNDQMGTNSPVEFGGPCGVRFHDVVDTMSPDIVACTAPGSTEAVGCPRTVRQNEDATGHPEGQVAMPTIGLLRVIAPVEP